MVTEEERVVFEYELHKLHREHRKCVNMSLKLQIEKDISLIKSAISTVSEQRM